MQACYVRICEATKPVFKGWGEELGTFLIIYVSPDTDRLEGLPNNGFSFGAYKDYAFECDPRFFSIRVEEKFGNSALMNYSNFVWEFCLPANKKAELEKLLKGEE
ncbi:MAG: hypothetical protein HYT16_01260 [DPANN group archaeon]|nr:hypothetical protein [DPANN group archaeon]